MEFLFSCITPVLYFFIIRHTVQSTVLIMIFYSTVSTYLPTEYTPSMESVFARIMGPEFSRSRQRTLSPRA